MVTDRRVAGDVDGELQRIDGVMRRATLIAALSAFAVANAVFFTLRFVWPELSLAVDAALGLAAAANVALCAWLSLRARGSVFAKGAEIEEEMPDLASLELRIEESAVEIDAPPADLAHAVVLATPVRLHRRAPARRVRREPRALAGRRDRDRPATAFDQRTT